MNISFSTLACPDWSWQDIIANGTRYGYDGVEVRLLQRETDLLSVPEFRLDQRATRKRELADVGFCISGLGSSVRFDHPEAADRQREAETGKAYLDLAAELGADFVRVFGDVVPDGPVGERETTIHHIADGLQSLGEYAQTLGVQVIMETHGDFSSSQLAQQTLQQVDCPAAGILWDTHHPWRFEQEPLAETYTRLKPWIRHTHWKDSISRNRAAGDNAVEQAAAEAHALMSGHRHADYVLFGGGEFPIAECLVLLLNDGFDGWFCYEWEKAWHPEIEDPEVALPLFPGKLKQTADLIRR